MTGLDGFQSLGDCFWLCSVNMNSCYREMNAWASRTVVSSPIRYNGNLSSESKKIPVRTGSLESSDSDKMLFISWKTDRISPQTDKTCKIWLTVSGQRYYEAIPSDVTSSRKIKGGITLLLCCWCSMGG